jgi:hypothetical protein
MAKKNSRSQSDDGSGITPPAPGQTVKPRRRRASEKGSDLQPSAAAAEASTSAPIAAPPRADDRHPADLSRSAARPGSMSPQPIEEAIRKRAYQRYLERGGGHGMAFDDWLEAERELNKG